MAHTTSPETEKPIDLSKPPAAGIVREDLLERGMHPLIMERGN